MEDNRLRSRDELPPMSDEDYGAWHNTVDVIGFTKGGRARIAYAQVWDEDCAPEPSDNTVRWKLAGSDGYDFDDIIGWIPIPKPETVEECAD